MIVGVLTKIQTSFLQSIIPKHYHMSQLAPSSYVIIPPFPACSISITDLSFCILVCQYFFVIFCFNSSEKRLYLTWTKKHCSYFCHEMQFSASCVSSHLLPCKWNDMLKCKMKLAAFYFTANKMLLFSYLYFFILLVSSQILSWLATSIVLWDVAPCSCTCSQIFRGIFFLCYQVSCTEECSVGDNLIS